MEQTCFICEDDLLLKYGRPCCSKVPLYKETKNKEFTSKLCVKQSIILSDILKSLSLLDENLLITDKSSTSVCKKCARKIVNCGSLFQELRSSITKKQKKRCRSKFRQWMCVDCGRKEVVNHIVS